MAKEGIALYLWEQVNIGTAGVGKVRTRCHVRNLDAHRTIITTHDASIDGRIARQRLALALRISNRSTTKASPVRLPRLAGLTVDKQGFYAQTLHTRYALG